MNSKDPIRSVIIEIENLKKDNKYKEAIKIVEDNLSKYDKEYRLYEELTDIYLYLWENDKARKAIDFALSLNKESATWNYLKWFLLLAIWENDKALIHLEKSNSMVWNNSEVLRNLWWAYNMNWNPKKGALILRRALNISPKDPLIAEDLAMALISWGNFDEWNELLIKIWKKSLDKNVK